MGGKAAGGKAARGKAAGSPAPLMPDRNISGPVIAPGGNPAVPLAARLKQSGASMRLVQSVRSLKGSQQVEAACHFGTSHICIIVLFFVY